MHTPPLLHRSRSALERGDHSEHRVQPRVREDPGYYRETPSNNFPMHQRADSPSSGSGSGDGQRTDSLAQHYESERSRPYRLRPVNQDDVDYDDGRMQNRESSGGGGGATTLPSQEPSRVPIESTRKRGRNEMDVDSDPEADAVESSASRGLHGNSGYMGARISDVRGAKRYHLPRNVDNHEDSRMGPP